MSYRCPKAKCESSFKLESPLATVGVESARLRAVLNSIVQGIGKYDCLENFVDCIVLYGGAGA
jgi:hypothetical protein